MKKSNLEVSDKTSYGLMIVRQVHLYEYSSAMSVLSDYTLRYM